MSENTKQNKDTTHDVQRNHKKKNKRLLSIIAGIIVVAILGGGLYAIKVLVPNEELPEPDNSNITLEESVGVELIRRDPVTVNKIDVQNSDGSYTVLRSSPPLKDGERSKFTISGYEKLSVNSLLLSTLAYNASDLQSLAVVGNKEEVEKFGLKEPAVTATLYYDSGETITFFVGDVSPTELAVYFMLEGDDNVYTVEVGKMANYRLSAEQFISLTILEEPPKDDYPTVLSVRIKRDNLDDDILIKYDSDAAGKVIEHGSSAAHILVEPFESNLELNEVVTVTNGLFGLSATEIYSVFPTEGKVAETGLNTPFCTVIIECDDGRVYTLLMSESFFDDSGTKSHYVMFEDGDLIYVVSAEKAVWATVNISDITAVLVYNAMIWDIHNMKISGKNITPIEFTATGTERANYSVQRKGEYYEGEKFRKFYSFLLNTYAENPAYKLSIPEDEPLVRIELYDAKTDFTSVVEYYENTAFTSLIVINGKTLFTCSKTYVDVLIENIKRLDTNEPFITTWS